ncbi:MAG: chemotaxis protein [Pseudomonadota bacterium]
MSDLLRSVDLRTKLAGNNRLELLTFYLNGGQKYGINVFKVREVMLCPEVSAVEDEHLAGIVYLRGHSIGVIDLNQTMSGVPCDDEKRFLIITEFSSSVQALLVRQVDRILNLEWQNIHQPPANLSNRSRLTATTECDGELIQILDLEQVIDAIDGKGNVERFDIRTNTPASVDLSEYEVVYCDDSVVARRNLGRCLEQIGVRSTSFENGRYALEYLLERSQEENWRAQILCLISDIEMPELDGFTLTSKIRERPGLDDLPIFLHSSLSGASNGEKALQMGANGFIAKFHPQDIADSINEAVYLLPEQRYGMATSGAADAS